MDSSRIIWRALVAFIFIVLNCAPRPTEKAMVGKVEGKAKLQLANGGTISQDNSDEYSPNLLQLSNGYLVLVFGSDRTCGTCTTGHHNIFVSQSVSPYDGIDLPIFSNPVVVTAVSTPINDPSPISFTATAQANDVVLYVNLWSSSGSIVKGVITNPLVPTLPGGFTSIANTAQQSNTIIGINSTGSELATVDYNGIAYLVKPDDTVASNPFGANLDYANSATQVRFENSGENDAFMGVYAASPFATTGTAYYGPMFDFQASLIDSGLTIGEVTTFYDSNPYADMVLFSAHDGTSWDIYVVTSHTSGMLWQLAAPFGFASFLPTAPIPDHYYDFEGGCGIDIGTPGGWGAACTSITPGAGSFNGTSLAPFLGSSYMVTSISQDVGSTFTISMWVNISPSCTGICTIASNSQNLAASSGYRLYYDGATSTIKFDTSNGSAITTAETMVGPVTTGIWQHVAVTVNIPATTAFIYVNGGLASSTFFTANTFTTTGQIYIGRMSAGTLSYFTGDMDDIRIYATELSPLDVLGVFLY